MTDNGSVTWLNILNENECNWLSLIKPAFDITEQNCIVFQLQNQVSYSTIREIKPGEALSVWYAKGYARKLGKPETPAAQVIDSHSQHDQGNQLLTGLAQQQQEDIVDSDVITDTELHISDQGLYEY